MRGRKRNGFVNLGDDDEPEASGKASGNKPKKSSKQQPERKAKSKRNRFSAKKNEDGEFRRQLEQHGTMSVNDMIGDGNCLFRSLSDQLYYDYGNKHEQTRQDICDYIEFMEEEFSVFLVLDENEEDEDAANFEEYVRTMRSDGEWGGNLELVAAARLYGRNIKVFSMAAGFTIDHGNEKSGGPDLMVSYHDNDHYNSVRHTNGKQPPPPTKFMPKARITKKTTAHLPEDISTDESGQTTGSTQTSTTEEESKSDRPKQSKKSSSKDLKKSSRKRSMPCPCGSGIKYKECCRKLKESSIKIPSKIKESSNKSVGDVNMVKKSRSSRNLDPSEAKDEPTIQMEGKFRMLKI